MESYPTALELIVANEDYSMMEIPIFPIVLEVKWSQYAHQIFYTFCVQSFAYMILFSFYLVSLPQDPVAPQDLANLRKFYFSKAITPIAVYRLIFEILLILSNLWRFIFGIREIMKARVFTFAFESSATVWFNFFLFVGAAICRLTSNVVAENTVLGFAAIVGWATLMTYSKGSRTLGPLVLSFGRILSLDVLRFAVLFSLILFGFSQAMWLQLAPTGILALQSMIPSNSTTLGLVDIPDNSMDMDWAHIGSSMLYLLRWVFGLADYNDVRRALVPDVASFYFYVYMIICFVILLNLFIAMLSSTYTKVDEDSMRVWQVQWADAVLKIDAYLSESQRKTLPRIGFLLGQSEVKSLPPTSFAASLRGKFRKGSKIDKLEIRDVFGHTLGSRYLQLDFLPDRVTPSRVVTSLTSDNDIGAKVLANSNSRSWFANMKPDLRKVGIQRTAETMFNAGYAAAKFKSNAK
ncbi:Transient receptor putative cation channel sub V member 4 [Nowakowskiella sp. JEL0078]|nr:Transient receptor putative cation channel sub V member 4 [Nowakowskiella sp. JEL0078]